MSSSDSETSFSPSLPISELIKHIKHSFLERDFTDIQNVLMERENAMKLEIENLTRDRDSARKEARSIEIEKSKIEGKLHKLEETVNRLFKENSASTKGEKKSVDCHDKLYTQKSETIDEKELIAELNEKIIELKNKLGQEIEDLRHERLTATQSVLELKRQNLEANRIIDVLRLEKSEVDKKAELNKSKLENLAPRIMKVEELLANILNVDVGNLAALVGEVHKLAKASEGVNLEYQYLKGKNDIFRNWSALDDAKDAVVKLAECRSIGFSRKGSDYSGAPSLVSGDIIEIPYSDDETNTAQPAYISNRGVCANTAENETSFEIHVQSPSLSSQTRGKRGRTDSGDDFLADLIPKRMRIMCTSHDDDDDDDGGGGGGDNDNNVSVDTKMPLQKFNGSNDEDSSCSDDSCSESKINDLIDSLGKHRRK